MNKLILLLVALMVIQPVFSQTDEDSTNLLAMGDEMPDFTLKTLEGKTVSSDDLFGKVVLVNFFATWCVPCNQELPAVEKEIWAKFKDNKDFVLLIIDRGEKPDVIQKHIDKKKWTMPFYLDESKAVYALFAKQFIPRNYLFDRSGELLLSSRGYNKDDLEILQREIERQLKIKL